MKNNYKKTKDKELIKMCCSILNSPVGELFIICSDKGVFNISYQSQPNFKLSSKDSVLMIQVKKELGEYFAGERQTWDVPIDWGEAKGFYLKARIACAKIKFGMTRSYSQLAKLTKNPRAVRAVGTAMSTNPHSILIPCHRVVKTGGNLGNYGGGLDAKSWLLHHEKDISNN